MVFFQSLLLGGYAYAHYLMQAPQPHDSGGGASALLLVVALLTLPLSIARRLGRAADVRAMHSGCWACSRSRSGCRSSRSPPTIRCCRPGSSRTGHPDGPDPYFLYASSNIGSFLALLSYPVLLEPMFTLRTQNLIWTGGYGLLDPVDRGLRRAAAALAGDAAAADTLPSDTDAPAPPWILRARWIFLAAVPSGLLDRGDRAYLHRCRRARRCCGCCRCRSIS